MNRYYDFKKYLARKYAEKKQIEAELYKIKYGKPKPKPRHLGFSQLYAIYLNIVCLIIICFAMYATLVLQDSQMVVVIIGGLLTSTISFTVSLNKSKAENTEGGIQFERFKHECKNEQEEDNEP